jgi:NifU-like protein involved in Fe-S cluster formation
MEGKSYMFKTLHNNLYIMKILRKKKKQEELKQPRVYWGRKWPQSRIKCSFCGRFMTYDKMRDHFVCKNKECISVRRGFGCSVTRYMD